MKFFIITNDPDRASFFDRAGVDRIFVDLEILGKQERQGHLDTVISRHCLDDVRAVKSVLKKSELLVRVDPINENSEYQIDAVINQGADVVMLPYFKTVDEVKKFVNIVNGRAKVNLLLETSEAFVRAEQILEIPGIDEIHVGLNDLSLSLGLDFMFEIISSSLLDFILPKIKSKGIPFGIGGVAPLETGAVPGELILTEFIRLGSSATILSRAYSRIYEDAPDLFVKEFEKIKKKVQEVSQTNEQFLVQNLNEIKQIIKKS